MASAGLGLGTPGKSVSATLRESGLRIGVGSMIVTALVAAASAAFEFDLIWVVAAPLIVCGAWMAIVVLAARP